jgi:acylphosphatase
LGNRRPKLSEYVVVQRGYRVTGRVQGVFFRAWTRDTALRLGLGGTVRNLPDGSVMVHLVGPVSFVERMEASLWKGPPASRVEGVDGVDSHDPMRADSFEILY